MAGQLTLSSVLYIDQVYIDVPYDYFTKRSITEDYFVYSLKRNGYVPHSHWLTLSGLKGELYMA